MQPNKYLVIINTVLQCLFKKKKIKTTEKPVYRK